MKGYVAKLIPEETIYVADIYLHTLATATCMALVMFN